MVYLLGYIGLCVVVWDTNIQFVPARACTRTVSRTDSKCIYTDTSTNKPTYTTGDEVVESPVTNTVIFFKFVSLEYHRAHDTEIYLYRWKDLVKICPLTRYFDECTERCVWRGKVLYLIVYGTPIFMER